MAETVQGLTISIEIRGTVIGSDGARQDVSWTKSYSFAEGTGVNQLGQWWYDETRSLNTTSEDLDLAGSLTAFNGDALALNNVKVLAIEWLDTDTGDGGKLKPGSAANVTTILTGTTPALNIGAGGFCLLVNPSDGYTVTATTADKIAVEALDDSTYRILVAGDNAT